MMAKRPQGLRVKKLGFEIDAAAGRGVELERHTASTANLHGRARRRQILRTEIRGLGTLHVGKATESPLGFAFGCFPPASPAFAPEAGKQKKTPRGLSKKPVCREKN